VSGVRRQLPVTSYQSPNYQLPINQSTNQPINQSTNQPINQLPINQSTTYTTFTLRPRREFGYALQIVYTGCLSDSGAYAGYSDGLVRIAGSV
jgi:hypothetical protein